MNQKHVLVREHGERQAEAASLLSRTEGAAINWKDIAPTKSGQSWRLWPRGESRVDGSSNEFRAAAYFSSTFTTFLPSILRPSTLLNLAAASAMLMPLSADSMMPVKASALSMSLSNWRSM